MTETHIPPHVVIMGAAGALSRAVIADFLEQGARLALVDHSMAHLSSAFPGLDNSQHLLLEADVTSATAMTPQSGA
ncbi:hypothetical protein [Variovorax sp. PBL-E5]|uniref:hypothetical protein n=1 Tax=Variovorax sp. PBL-E5 TaxID=434014 RepID=UPI001317149D|nr:hypothetical protein [Variovorax sp. PBL-E5]VTU45087.1 short chain dehydrogenase [Variovorax sp. PBL-E5]